MSDPTLFNTPVAVSDLIAKPADQFAECLIILHTPVWPLWKKPKDKLHMYVQTEPEKVNKSWALTAGSIFVPAYLPASVTSNPNDFLFVALRQVSQFLLTDVDELTLSGFFVRAGSLQAPEPKYARMGKKVRKQYYVESARTPGKRYEVISYADGSLSCNCPQWKFRGHNCKHVKEVDLIIAKEVAP